MAATAAFDATASKTMRAARAIAVQKRPACRAFLLPAAVGGAHSQTLFYAYLGASNLRQPVLYVCNRLSAWPILFFAP